MDSLQIIGNVIRIRPTSTFADGIGIFDSEDIWIEENEIQAGGEGINLSDINFDAAGGPSRSTVINNMVSSINSPALFLDDINDTDEAMLDDLTEGFGDSDGDGIPDYLDASDGTLGQANLLDDQTIAISTRHWLETETGLNLRIGDTAQAAGSYGALLTDDEVEDFGGPAGGASPYPDDGFEHFVGVYDYTVSGMLAGSSARIVIPLPVGIPKNAEFRKFDPQSGWAAFVEDDNNALYSASGETGACPEPGSSLYSPGLNFLDNCLQLLVEDGGHNDSGRD